MIAKGLITGAVMSAAAALGNITANVDMDKLMTGDPVAVQSLMTDVSVAVAPVEQQIKANGYNFETAGRQVVRMATDPRQNVIAQKVDTMVAQPVERFLHGMWMEARHR